MDFTNPDGMRDLYKSIYISEETEIEEATLSAKAARSGKDIGKPGKQFEKIAKKAGERYGSKERGEKVAGAVLAKMRAKAAHEEIDLYDRMLEFLCVEGYADTLEEAEWIMANELIGENLEEILEGKKEPNLEKMKSKEAKHASDAFKKGTDDDGKYRSASRNKSMKMRGIRGAIERGEDPRADTYGGAQKKPVDHRAGFSKNPLNNPPRPVKKPGV